MYFFFTFEYDSLYILNSISFEYGYTMYIINATAKCYSTYIMYVSVLTQEAKLGSLVI